MKRAWLTTGIVALVMAMALPLAFAQGRGGRGMGPDGCRGPKCVLKSLDLSADQQKAVDALRDQHRDVLKSLKANVKAAHEALRALAERDDATIADAEAAELAMFQAHQAVQAERRAHRAAILEILTPEQRAKVPNGWRLGLDRGPGMGPGMGHGMRHGMKGRGGGGWGMGHGGPPDMAPPDVDED